MTRTALMPVAISMMALWGAPAPAQSTLCGAGATSLFTCPIGHKLVSICAAGGKATYQFGTPEKVEMSSQALSYANHAFSGGGETQISVRNQAYIYIVYAKTVRTSFSPDGHNDPDSTSGLIVQKNGRTISATACGSDATMSVIARQVIPQGAFIEH